MCSRQLGSDKRETLNTAREAHNTQLGFQKIKGV